jgi:hypothetical protein
MDAGNPYAPPKAPLAEPPDRAPPDPADDLPAWRIEDGKLLVRHRATLPDICLYTGEATEPAQRLTFPFSWTPTWFRVAMVLFPFPAFFAYNVLRKTSTAEIGLSAPGRKRRRLCLLLTLGAVACGVLFALIASGPRETGGALGLFGLSFFAFLAGALLTRVFRVVRIDRHYAHLAVRPAVARAFAFARLPAPSPPAPR